MRELVPKKKVINHVSIAHGSQIRNNWHREKARDDFLVTVDRASAFLSGAKPIPFVDSEKSEFLHIGNDPNREKQLQPEKGAREEEERARKHAREEEERAREEDDAALDGELLRLEIVMKAEERARKKVRKEEESTRRKEERIVMKAQERVRKKVRKIPIFLKKMYHMIETCDPTICGWTDGGEMLVVKNQVRYSFGF